MVWRKLVSRAYCLFDIIKSPGNEVGYGAIADIVTIVSALPDNYSYISISKRERERSQEQSL